MRPELGGGVAPHPALSPAGRGGDAKYPSPLWGEGGARAAQQRGRVRGASATRRALLAALPALALAGRAYAAPLEATPDFAAIERAGGGELGVFVIDTGSGRTQGWRADARFPFCSSFKAPLAAMVLAECDRGRLRLDQPVRYGPADLMSYAPITRQHVAAGEMTLEALCAAAVSYSDNTAANLLLKTLGGPAALTAWMRGHGDGAFQLSHNEPALNYARFGGGSDTTTAAAMAQSFRRILFGPVLQPPSRARLAGWLVANTTGAKRIRAGLPPGWRVGDKTGTYADGWRSCVDIAVAWPPGRAPLIIAAFVTDVSTLDAGEAALAGVGRGAAVWAPQGG